MRMIQINIPAPAETPDPIRSAAMHWHMVVEHLDAFCKAIVEEAGISVTFGINVTTCPIDTPKLQSVMERVVREQAMMKRQISD